MPAVVLVAHDDPLTGIEVDALIKDLQSISTHNEFEFVGTDPHNCLIEAQRIIPDYIVLVIGPNERQFCLLAEALWEHPITRRTQLRFMVTAGSDPESDLEIPNEPPPLAQPIHPVRFLADEITTLLESEVN